MVSIWYKPTTTRAIIPFSKQLFQLFWAKAMSVCAIQNEKSKTTKSETYGLARYWFLCWIDTIMRKGICWTWMAPRAPDPLIFQPKWTIIHHMSSLFCDVCLGTVEHGRMVSVFCWCIWWAHGFQHWLKAIRWFFLKPPFGNPSQRLIVFVPSHWSQGTFPGICKRCLKRYGFPWVSFRFPMKKRHQTVLDHQSPEVRTAPSPVSSLGPRPSNASRKWTAGSCGKETNKRRGSMWSLRIWSSGGI
jgi:hypothetical protein